MPKSVTSNSFLPPKLNPLVTRLIQSIVPCIVYWGYQLELNISDEDVNKVKAIASDRVIYLPNHSNLDDGLVIFGLSARLGQLFNYIVAYDAFRGLIGKLLQTVGAYSIRRGMGDRTSIMQTLKILQQPACKLVIFPEGGCSYQNDTVMPFRSGAIELSFKAIAELVKKNNTLPDFYLVPVSLKYRYTQEMDSAIASTLQRLETALQIQPETQDCYLRTRTIAREIFNNLATKYNFAIELTEDWNRAIEELKIQLLNWCEQKLNIEPNPQIAMRERVYKIQAYLESENDKSSPVTLEIKTAISKAAFTLLNFDAIYDGYVAENPTAERFLDTLNRFEREVFQIDRPQPKGHRRACIVIGTPINLKDFWQSYQQNRESTIVTLTQQLQTTVRENLTTDHSS
ncbi:MAG: 1-acyl-sn-glycerol-3-phosphate acyltransferase [Pleurocapsa sp.]